jgi:hypothetical protein
MIIPLILTIALGGLPNLIYVPDHSPTVQGAIDGAAGGDTIIVRAGTYFETIDFRGKAILVTSESGPAVTVLDGGFTGRDSTVTFRSGEGVLAILERFTITNGQNSSGGGILCENGSSPTIRDNRITDNSAHNNGGAIACRNGSAPLIERNVIPQNGADRGGAIHCRDSSPAIRDNVIGLDFMGNGSKEGGGIYLDNASPFVTGNLISGNGALFGGGGINCDNGSRPVITNNVIFNNRAYTGAAIACENSSRPTITNNTFTANIAYSQGGGILLTSSSAEMANTILWGNDAQEGAEICLVSASSLTVDHSDVAGGQAAAFVVPGSTLTWGAGNLTVDPLLADGPGGDVHLTFGSPCRQSGDTGASSLPGEDFEGDPRSAPVSVDIGADEFHPHLYTLGAIVPGSPITVRIAGRPGLPTLLAASSGIAEPPLPTPYGLLRLTLPLLNSWSLRPVPATGILTLPVTVPWGWSVGKEHPFQALVGPIGGADTLLTNLLVLTVD